MSGSYTTKLDGNILILGKTNSNKTSLVSVNGVLRMFLMVKKYIG